MLINHLFTSAYSPLFYRKVRIHLIKKKYFVTSYINYHTNIIIKHYIAINNKCVISFLFIPHVQ